VLHEHGYAHDMQPIGARLSSGTCFGAFHEQCLRYLLALFLEEAGVGLEAGDEVNAAVERIAQ